jgi:glycosyltransferase involved in cell wall biosynthesis
MRNKIVIIVPCFNEEKRFNRNYFNELASIQNTFWVFVDDGSTDHTGEVLKNISSKTNTLYFRINHNVGKSNAIAQSMQHVFSNISGINWVGFLDSDGAFAVSDVKNIIKMTKSIKFYDAIYSSRIKMAGRNINRNGTRHIFARIIISFFGLVWKNMPYDTQSGFKLYRNSRKFRSLFTSVYQTRWFFDIELMLKYLQHNGSELKVWEQPVSLWSDVQGSKINLGQIKVIFFEIIYIQFKLFRLKKLLKVTNSI